MAGDAPAGRPMKYPYTFTAKIVQFPFAHYYKHSWVFRYLPFGILLTLPIFYKIQKLSYSPENVAKWKELDRKTFEGHHH